MTITPHPYRPALKANPEWELVLTKHAELYVEDHERRQAPEREPSRMHVAIGILAVIGIALALLAAIT